MIKRLLLILGAAFIGLALLMLFSYKIINIQWISFMGIQPSFKPMEHPLPVPPNSIPIEGAAYIPGMGAPVNPVPADAASIARGEELFKINCLICHGPQGLGNGKVASFFEHKPANLTSPAVQDLSDGAIFLVISTGVAGRMPALNENLLVRDRWDVINYVRTLKQQK
jgi:mono/diheme cytochrome c family protein